MKKTLNFLFIILIIIVAAYLFAPGKETTNKLWVVRGLSLAQPYKAAVIEYIQRTNSLPLPGDLEHEKILVKVDFSHTPVKTITIGEEGPGTVTVHFITTGFDSVPPEINNKSITLTPNMTNNKLTWSCRSTLPVEFTPSVCK